MTAEQHMADAAVAVALAAVFPADRRHWLRLASADMDKAHALRMADAVARVEAGPMVAPTFDEVLALFGR